jgi:hypothetical protein
MAHLRIGKPPVRMSEPKGGTTHATLHPHGDGTYHLVHHKSGSYSYGHAVMEHAKRHATGNHYHLHASEDGEYTSHHMVDGKVGGPEEHDTMREAKAHMGDTMECD